MAERKVSSKWYPPDFDPSIASKRSKATKRNKPKPVTLMVPFPMRCTNNTCGAFIGKGSKFNAKKETMDEKYLNITRYRFYIRCRECRSELSFCTDPQNGDYVCEKGVQPVTKSRIRAATDQTDAEIVDHLQSLIQEEDLEEENDKMAELEEKMQDSKREMEVADALDEILARNARIERNAQKGIHEVAQEGIHEVAQEGIHEAAQMGNHEVAQMGNHETAQEGIHEAAQMGNHEAAQQQVENVHPKYNHLVRQPGVLVPKHWDEDRKRRRKEFPDLVTVWRWEALDVSPEEELELMDDVVEWKAYMKEKSFRAYNDVYGNYLIRDPKGRVVYLMPPEEQAQGLHKVKDAYKNYPPYKPGPSAQPARPAADEGGEWEIVEVNEPEESDTDEETREWLKNRRKKRTSRPGLNLPKGLKLREVPREEPDADAKDGSKSKDGSK